jgi:hypothetical protein
MRHDDVQLEQKWCTFWLQLQYGAADIAVRGGEARGALTETLEMFCEVCEVEEPLGMVLVV